MPKLICTTCTNIINTLTRRETTQYLLQMKRCPKCGEFTIDMYKPNIHEKKTRPKV